MQLFVVFKNQVIYVSITWYSCYHYSEIATWKYLIILTKNKVRTEKNIVLIMPLTYVNHNNGQK